MWCLLATVLTHDVARVCRVQLRLFFTQVHARLGGAEHYAVSVDDVVDELQDMVCAAFPDAITLPDLVRCGLSGTVASMLLCVKEFSAHDNREESLLESAGSAVPPGSPHLLPEDEALDAEQPDAGARAADAAMPACHSPAEPEDEHG
jgi:hypothetical protein